MQESIRNNPAKPHHSRSNSSSCREPRGPGTRPPPLLGCSGGGHRARSLRVGLPWARAPQGSRRAGDAPDLRSRPGPSHTGTRPPGCPLACHPRDARLGLHTPAPPARSQGPASRGARAVTPGAVDPRGLLRASGWDFAHTISLPAWGRWHVRAHVTAGGQPGGFPDSQTAAPLWPPRPCRDPPLTPRTAPFSCLILTALPAADRRAASGDRARGLQGRWRLGPELVRGTSCSPCAPQQTEPRSAQAGTGYSSITGPLRVVPQHLEPQPLAQALSRGPSQQTEAGEPPGLAVSPACPWAAPAPPPRTPSPSGPATPHRPQPQGAQLCSCGPG